MADHSFKSAKDRRLGSLLHYQQPNLPQTHPLAFLKLYYYSEFYAELMGRLFTCYAPVRHDLLKNIRLACVTHTNSIYSEPGSNSIKYYN